MAEYSEWVCGARYVVIEQRCSHVGTVARETVVTADDVRERVFRRCTRCGSYV